jgi:hypothetical protein
VQCCRQFSISLDLIIEAKMTKFIKAITLIFLIYFIFISIYFIYVFFSASFSIEKTGREIGDDFAQMMILILILFSLIFLCWTYYVYKKNKTLTNIYFQLGLIFSLGILAPAIFILKFLF